MADLFRGPLLVSRREFDPRLAVPAWTVASSQLVTVLAANATPLPIGQQSLRHVPQRLHNNRDTSQSSPLTLLAVVAAAPFVPVPVLHVGRARWQPPDVSQGVPKTLFADAQLPVGAQRERSAPWRMPIVVDTSAGMAKVLSAPPLVSGPSDQLVTEGAAATFTVVALGTDGAISYQWQSDTGTGFSNIGGATSSSYTTPATTLADAGTLFRCIVSDANGSTTSGSATLLVNAAVVTTTSVGHGKPRRRKQYVVIDGEAFEVASDQEAIDLIRRAHELARQAAQAKAAAELDKQVAEPTRKKVRKLRPPVIKASPQIEQRIAPDLEAARAYLAQVYEQAIAQEIERRAAEERDLQAVIDAVDRAEIELLMAYTGTMQ